jgi:4-amino-4-deoxy-L-arabinose transferase-like glycosyltransferase
MRRKNILYGLLFFAPLLLYINFMSIGLDDFDSFAFAFALDRWDTALIEVHPPNFPIYVFISKFVQLIVQDTQLALTLVSVISGAIGIVLTALIPDTHTHKHAGIIAGLLLIFLPGYWLNSELALSDIPGITFALLSVVCLFNVRDGRANRYFIFGCFFAGLSLGVRPHNSIPIALAGLSALYNLRPIDTKFLQKLGLGVLAGIIGITIWLVPIYQTFDGYQGHTGFDGYFQRLDNHRQHIQSADSLFRQELNITNITRRINAYVDGWSHLLAGHDNTTLLLIVGLMLIGIVKLPFKQRFTWFVLIWFTAEASKIFLLASLERPRLYLPALIPLILLVALGYSNWRNRYKFMRLGVIGIISLSLLTSLPIIQKLNQIPPPPEQATDYILVTYPLANGTALVVSQGSFQSAQYHLGDYKQLYTPYFDAEAWSNNIAYDQPDYLIILDGNDIASEVFSALTTDLRYVTIDDRIFERDPRIFPQHSTVRLQVMVQEKDLQPEQLQLPESGLIATRDTEHSKYFSEGWYRIEDVGGTFARWSNQTAVLRISLPPKDTIMTFVATPYLDGQSVEVIANDITIDTLDITDIWETYQITIPADVISNHAISTIELHHSLAEYPENHNRQLATAYHEFQFE